MHKKQRKVYTWK